MTDLAASEAVYHMVIKQAALCVAFLIEHRPWVAESNKFAQIRKDAVKIGDFEIICLERRHRTMTAESSSAVRSFPPAIGLSQIVAKPCRRTVSAP